MTALIIAVLAWHHWMVISFNCTFNFCSSKKVEVIYRYREIRNNMRVQYRQIRDYLTVLYHHITGTSWNCYLTVHWKMDKFEILKYYWAITARILRSPRYKNFAECFFNGLTAVHQAMLYSALVCHYSAGLSWSNIQILWTW